MTPPGEEVKEPDPYTQLDSMHKLIEVQRATIADLKGKLANLKDTIAEHCNNIFKEVKVQ